MKEGSDTEGVNLEPRSLALSSGLSLSDKLETVSLSETAERGFQTQVAAFRAAGCCHSSGSLSVLLPPEFSF